MWGDQQFGGGGANGGGGGGFFSSPNQFGSATNTPNNKAKRTGKRNSRTAPIVIAQALKCPDDGIKIWGSEVQIVSLVARINDINVQSSKIVYSIEDITGKMEAMLWIDQDTMNDGEDKTIPNVMVNTYVQIFGNIKNSRGKKVLIVFKILNISNVNAITFHYLQCINNKIKMEAKSKGAQTNGDVTMPTSAMPANSMMTNMDVGGATAGLNQRQLMVFALIRAAKLEEGTSRQDMQSNLRDKMSKTELDKILEWMCGEGHIYSTIDEDHFRATDAS